MTFICHYIKQAPDAGSYYRTVYADSINEAAMLAKRYERKGYICKTIKQKLGGF